ncbi:probable bifunctional methylthioribulose-1-phosphate dehydratase/enolase-phosphatase E1 [Populus alba]|uniref:probable bifunctional methylthioribulose-1-phosphate dehydratase/enolase-phosphatase E1 n=1 Tax=Populus alba TaxID=43335 RepID=UPI003CC705A7
MAAAPPAVAVDGGMAAAKVASQAYLETKAVKDTGVLIVDLCKQFYSLGWVSGTGGSITIKAHDDSIPKRVQKERMEPEDMYVFATNGSILSSPSPKPYPHKPPKCSDCASLFLKSYDMRNAGDVIHSPGSSFFLNLQITYMEMIKGIQGHGYYDELVVPIIENTAYENKLTDSLAKAIGPIQKVKGVLGCNGNVKMVVKEGMNNSDNGTGPLPRCIVLDIEGTTTPIIFVADVLFPYAHDNVGRHLSATYETAETHDDIKLLRTQVRIIIRSFGTIAINMLYQIDYGFYCMLLVEL